MMIANAKLEDAVTEQREDYILVPRIPTSAMLEAAADYALAEDASGVWGAMLRQCQTDSSRPIVGIQALSMGCCPSSETLEIYSL